MTILYFQPNDCPAGQAKFNGAAARAHERGAILQTVGAADNEKTVRSLLDFWHPDACIVESGDDTHYLRPTVFGNVPTVFIDRDPKSLSRSARAVNIDSAALGQAAARELLRLGYAHVGIVPVAKPTFWGIERTTAFIRAIELNGRACHVYRHPSKGADDNKALSNWLANLPRPCGIFATTDILGARVLSAIRRLDASVPEDFAVIGADNDETICENTTPTLSSLALDFREAGRLAVDAVCDRLPGVRHFGVREIVRRASTFVPNKNLPGVSKAIDLIRQQACQGLRARDVVVAMGVSRRLAEMRFRAATGQTLLNAIRDQRVRRAKELLADNQTALETIPLLCGWSGTATFRRYFKAQVGLTMRDWRAMILSRTRTNAAPFTGSASRERPCAT